MLLFLHLFGVNSAGLLVIGYGITLKVSKSKYKIRYHISAAL